MKLSDVKQKFQQLISNRKLMFAIGVYLLGTFLFVGFFYFRSHPPTPQGPIRQTGIIVQQSYDGALPLKPINQDKYRKIIQKSWEEALVKGSTNIVTFPKDPELIAFTYTQPGSTREQSFVLYKNKPITIKTKKVLELPGGVTSRTTLSSANYALVVLFEYTPAISELNIEQTLAIAFKQAIEGKAM